MIVYSMIMTSNIYFTSTRQVRENDIINAFENELRLGKIHEGNVAIVPVLKRGYNHVFFNIKWNETVEAAEFVKELTSKSSAKIYHNRGYWLCRLNRNPRTNSSPCITGATLVNPKHSLAVATYNNDWCEDDFYVIN